MDGRRPLSSRTPAKGASYNSEFSTDEESDVENTASGVPLVNVNGTVVEGVAIIEGESDNEQDYESGSDDFEIDSLFEDTLEELGDEHLLNTGGSSY